jgi:hypothetical protein
MPSTTPWSCLALLSALWLAACAGAIGAQPDLIAEVKRYYDAHAMEEGGLCGSPVLGGVTGSKIEEESAERLTIRVSYSYRDPSMNPAGYTPETLFTGRKSNIAGPSQCKGFGTRSFTLARRADGYGVLDMSGPQRKGIRINRIDKSKVW